MGIASQKCCCCGVLIAGICVAGMDSVFALSASIFIVYAIGATQAWIHILTLVLVLASIPVKFYLGLACRFKRSKLAIPYLAWKPLELILETIPILYFGFKFEALYAQKSINAGRPIQGQGSGWSVGSLEQSIFFPAHILFLLVTFAAIHMVLGVGFLAAAVGAFRHLRFAERPREYESQEAVVAGFATETEEAGRVSEPAEEPNKP